MSQLIKQVRNMVNTAKEILAFLALYIGAIVLLIFALFGLVGGFDHILDEFAQEENICPNNTVFVQRCINEGVIFNDRVLRCNQTKPVSDLVDCEGILIPKTELICVEWGDFRCVIR